MGAGRRTHIRVYQSGVVHFWVVQNKSLGLAVANPIVFNRENRFAA